MTLDFRALCGWILARHKEHPERYWNTEQDCFDLPKLREALPSIPASDIMLAAHVTKYDVYLWRESHKEETAVN